MVTVDGRKMGKSLGNFITLKDAYTRWSPQIVRFFILQSHYRSTLDFSSEAVEGARKGYERLQNSIRTIRERVASPSTGGVPLGVDIAAVRAAFTEAMNDDFNTPQAISVLFDLAREVNQRLAAHSSVAADDLHAVLALYDELAGKILGLGIGVSAVRGDGESLETHLIDLLLDLRTEVRKEKLWKLSDRIRDGLAALGITLEDKREGTTWRRTSP
jgi:cysteinyl-tRNA synthetase